MIRVLLVEDNPVNQIVAKSMLGALSSSATLVGAYAATFKDDLVLSIEAEVIGREAWEPNAEIAEVGFFTQDALPQPMHPFTATRIRDAFAGQTGIIRVLENQ